MYYLRCFGSSGWSEEVGWQKESSWYNIVMKRKQLWCLFLKYFLTSDESILIHVQVQIFLTEEIKLNKKNLKQTINIYLSASNKMKTFLWENAVSSYYDRVMHSGT